MKGSPNTHVHPCIAYIAHMHCIYVAHMLAHCFAPMSLHTCIAYMLHIALHPCHISWGYASRTSIHPRYMNIHSTPPFGCAPWDELMPRQYCQLFLGPPGSRGYIAIYLCPLFWTFLFRDTVFLSAGISRNLHSFSFPLFPALTV